jgi:hypothetical protein
VREVVVREFAAREDLVDEREADFGAVAHGDRGSAISICSRTRVSASPLMVSLFPGTPIAR